LACFPAWANINSKYCSNIFPNHIYFAQFKQTSCTPSTGGNKARSADHIYTVWIGCHEKSVQELFKLEDRGPFSAKCNSKTNSLKWILIPNAAQNDRGPQTRNVLVEPNQFEHNGRIGGSGSISKSSNDILGCQVNEKGPCRKTRGAFIGRRKGVRKRRI
jgi:hypothetical protein